MAKTKKPEQAIFYQNFKGAHHTVKTHHPSKEESPRNE